MKKGLIVALTLISIIFIIIFSCALERDPLREPEYSPKNKITGFNKPTKLKLVNNDLFLFDSGIGIYKIDLTTVDLTKDYDKTSVATLIYNNDTSGDVINFDVDNEYLYCILYKDEYYYIFRQKLSDSTKVSVKIPNKLPAFNIKVYNNYIFVSGNFNMSVGLIASDKLTDNTPDNYFYYSKNTYSPKDIEVAGSSPSFKIYVGSAADNEIGIETYNFNDPTIDANNTNLFPFIDKFPFSLKRESNDLYFSTHKKVSIIDISNPSSPSLTKNINFDIDIAIFDTEIYQSSSLASLYGYSIKVDKYSTNEYEVAPYYSGIKIISNYKTSPVEQKNKEIFIKGWAKDFVIYNDFTLSANQIEKEITINRIK